MTLDIDGLPIEVFGYQGGSAYNGHAKARIYPPLIASLAETGGMIVGLLREGKAGPAEDVDTWIPHLIQRLAEGLNLETDQIQVRLEPAIPMSRRCVRWIPGTLPIWCVFRRT